MVGNVAAVVVVRHLAGFVMGTEKKRGGLLTWRCHMERGGGGQSSWSMSRWRGGPTSTRVVSSSSWSHRRGEVEAGGGRRRGVVVVAVVSLTWQGEAGGSTWPGGSRRGVVDVVALTWVCRRGGVDVGLLTWWPSSSSLTWLGSSWAQRKEGGDLLTWRCHMERGGGGRSSWSMSRWRGGLRSTRVVSSSSSSHRRGEVEAGGGRRRDVAVVAVISLTWRGEAGARRHGMGVMVVEVVGLDVTWGSLVPTTSYHKP